MTTLLTVLIGLAMVSPVLFFVVAISELVQGNPPVHPIAFVVFAVVITLYVLMLVLVRRVRQGNRTAWIILLVLLGIETVFLLIGGAYELVANGSPLALAVAAVPALMFILLIAPRSSRAYFNRHRAAPAGH
ncbi:hypothetical protein GA0074704_1771 [Micromonospora siamensis]|uniref:Uncharacterized protein n=1 Tax=Micromonospora siamensis TaxID=299152 RepID=A0A1C5HI34_9ACTN|nr:hypothetical protein GA0074704_1771 [Micromonospora siamensis]